EKNRDLRHLQISHAERVMKTQQEAELKRIRAEANAKVREAQLRGMAQTAVAAREQAAGFLGQRRGGQQAALPDADDTQDAQADVAPAISAPAEATIVSAHSSDEQAPTRLFTPNSRRDLSGAGRSGREMYNHAASAAGAARPEPMGARAALSQPSLLNDATPDTLGGSDADVSASWAGRPRPSIGAGIAAFFPSETDGLTGTTGPRPAIRRSAEPSPLLRTMNDPHARTVEQVETVISELKATGIQPVQRDVIAALQERYGVDDATARKMANIYRTAKKEQRG
ncbi:MAG: hypothetical protein KGO05_05930, partial [Chloroflexota bacterium]|nr:hypothetical protein [Chloroflexota bacterium]